MKDSEFIQKRDDRGKIAQTCYYIEKAAHELQLMSRRQHMTVTQLQAQVRVLQKWLSDIDEQLTTSGDATPQSQ